MGTNEREPNGTENQQYQHAEGPEERIKNRLNRCLGVALGVIIAVGTASIGKATDPQYRLRPPWEAVDQCTALDSAMQSLEDKRQADRRAYESGGSLAPVRQDEKAMGEVAEKQQKEGCPATPKRGSGWGVG